MKMFLIIYDVEFEDEVMEVMTRCSVSGYTKWERVLGKGKRSAPRFNDPVWPGYNSAIMVAPEPGVEEMLLSSLEDLSRSLGERSLKVFLWPLERVI